MSRIVLGLLHNYNTFVYSRFFNFNILHSFNNKPRVSLYATPLTCHPSTWLAPELLNVEGSATPQRLRTPAIGLMAAYGSRGRAPTVKNYALPSDLEAKSLECDDYA